MNIEDLSAVEQGEGRSQTGIWARLKQDIKDIAPSLGIDDIGFATAEPFMSLKEVLLDRRAKNYESGFEEPDIEKRIYPELSLERPASIISIAVAYPAKMSGPPKSEPGKRRGILARSAWGQDYHHVLREAMGKLEAYIKSRVKDARIESMVDTGALVDRAVAERAGIGFKAKNTMLISPKFGSWIYLGEMLTNIPFEPDTPVTEDCGECTKCLEACPTGALVEPGVLNAKHCISYLTQTKDFLDERWMKKIGNRLYGCDTCQMVCPKNKGKSWNHHPELQPDPEVVKPLLLPILELSNKEFKKRFGSSAAAWRGKKPIQRNAIIALGNFKDQDSIPKIIEMMKNDTRPVIRGTAAWALSRIGGKKALQAVNEAICSEKDEEVLQRLNMAKDTLEAELLEKDRLEAQANAVSIHHPEAMITEVVEQAVEKIYYDVIDSPIGHLTLCSSDKGLCHLEFGVFEDRQSLLEGWATRYYSEARWIYSPEHLSEVAKQLSEYFAGVRRRFDLKLDMQGTDFQRKVWKALLEIPYGQTLSYKEVAVRLGQPGAVRAVGGANNKNPIPVIVPCHRVIGSSGNLVGYGGGLSIKERLLSLERASYIK